MSANIVGVGHTGALNMWIATLEMLEIGSLQWTNVHVGVANLKNWGLAEPETNTEEVQGVLGRDMLTTRGALIDYHSRKLWFLLPT